METRTQCTIPYYSYVPWETIGATLPGTMTSQKRILVTGGCGYIGSHTLVSLLDPASTSQTNIEYSVVVVGGCLIETWDNP